MYTFPYGWKPCVLLQKFLKKYKYKTFLIESGTGENRQDKCPHNFQFCGLLV